MASWLITGANRGIGFEFARQLAERGESVTGTARHPESAKELARLAVRVESLDVADPTSVNELVQRLGRRPIDVLINNAGIGGPDAGIEEISRDELVRCFEVDAIGPLAVTRALLSNLRAGKGRRVVNLSSGLASIAQNDNGGWYAYRAAKAALNQFTRTLAAELASEDFVCIAISPGWVRTDMGGGGAPQSKEDSVRGMLRVIDRLSSSDNGRFLSHRGHEIPW